MILIDNVKKDRAAINRVVDYLWGGFSGFATICLLIALWQLGSEKFGEFMLPAPKVVFLKAYSLLLEYKASEIDVTLFRSLVGVGTACIIGITLGLIAGAYKSFAALLKPLITVLLAMPPIIWIVMAIFWFGFGNFSTIFTIIITVLPLTFASSAVGMMSVSEELKEMFDAYHLGLVRKIRHLYIPHLTGYIISSLSVAVAMGVKIVIMAELLGANEGMGAKIASARVMLDTTEVMAYVVLVITLIMLFEYLIIEPLKIALMPWKR
ncbi:ABC transporter permease [Campylobacter sp. CCUG 57310]|uniref:ABC transporter permease n=1 Tax=Campylobacter sp. CCUG 57310 TaxID=2517362 RepID=UPI0015665024|nr:ABC transporter permease subunit [Campylobacter sp. CCUG 57310]QKF91435.1 nitrate/sulfonate/bicarbonate ABC transporter, permease protein [Campylobacter sp. CCUG 57310]